MGPVARRRRLAGRSSERSALALHHTAGVFERIHIHLGRQHRCTRGMVCCRSLVGRRPRPTGVLKHRLPVPSPRIGDDRWIPERGNRPRIGHTSGKGGSHEHTSACKATTWTSRSGRTLYHHRQCDVLPGASVKGQAFSPRGRSHTIPRQVRFRTGDTHVLHQRVHLLCSGQCR